mgnify:CR=1 FL=1
MANGEQDDSLLKALFKESFQGNFFVNSRKKTPKFSFKKKNNHTYQYTCIEGTGRCKNWEIVSVGFSYPNYSVVKTFYTFYM